MVHFAFYFIFFCRAQFAAIKDVAEFVGSPLSDKELCCIATEGSKDMGSHTASRHERGKITSRFGKWKVRTLLQSACTLWHVGGVCMATGTLGDLRASVTVNGVLALAERSTIQQ